MPKYAVTNIKGIQGYIDAINLVEDQLGKPFDHKYDAHQGVMVFTIPVEIDLHPIKEAGFGARDMSV